MTELSTKSAPFRITVSAQFINYKIETHSFTFFKKKTPFQCTQHTDDYTLVRDFYFCSYKMV
jgi:hypothetical protein